MSETNEGGAWIALEWSEGRTLRDFALDTSEDHRTQFSVAGVYIWVITPPSGDAYLSYVGRATGSPTLLDRMRTHYLLQIGVSYRIRTPFIPQKYVVARSPDRWVIDWANQACLSALADEEQVVDLVRGGFRFADTAMVFAAKVDKAKVKAVERQLLWDLQPEDTIWGKGSRPTPRVVEIHHRNAGWATEAVRRVFKEPLLHVP